MIIKKENLEFQKPIVDLNGSEGNAFVLLGYARKWGKQLGKSSEEIENIVNEMMSDDYDNLVNVLDENFGKYVILVK